MLVTGAAGFIGGHVVDQLRAAGRSVIEVPHAWEGAQDLDDLVGSRSVRSCIHLGWYATPGDYLVNVAGNLRSLQSSCVLVDWLGNRGAQHLVVAGTCAEYGESDQPHDEVECPAPWSAYGAAKVSLWYLLASSMRPAGLSVAWARLFHLTGPGERRDRLIPWVVRSVLNGDSVALSSGLQMRDYLDVADVAAALVALNEVQAQGTFNICSGRGTQLRDLLTSIGQQIGAVDLLDFGARPYGPNDPAVLLGRNERLRAVTGWSPAFDRDAMIDRLVRYWTHDLGESP